MSFKPLDALSIFSLNKILKDYYKRITGLSNRVKTLETGGGTTFQSPDGSTWAITGVTNDGALITTKQS
jgi:hypothetical protein